MSDKYSCIKLGIISPINNIIGLIPRNFNVKQRRPVIQFRHFRFFSMTVNLDLFGINLGGTSKPCFSYP